MKKALIVVATLSLVVFNACWDRGNTAAHSGQTPEEVVKSFIDISTTAKENGDKRKLQDLCVGELRRTFERMNEEAFRLIYLDSKVTLLEFKTLESKVEANNARVAYQVTVENKQGTDPTKEVNQREVDLIRSQGAWYIDTIRMRGSDQIAFTRGMLF